MCWKIPSAAFQIYVGTLVTSVGSSTEPWIDLKTLAHLGAAVATCRGIDAVLDMTFGRLVHGNSQDELKKIAEETTALLKAQNDAKI